ncbi:MAG: IS21 family transposase [bacterium]|nr:IS21 family transposase [bacterium]
MPAERLSMRKVREVLRLSWGGKLSTRAVARSCGIGRTTVREYLQRAIGAGLSWPLPEGLSDGELEALLFPPPVSADNAPRPLPDWKALHKELKRKGVTLFLLWEEYKAVHPEGYEYSRFCDLYRQWAGKLPVWMRQEHKAGEKLFVDYAGMTMPVTNQQTGEVRQAQIFVATLGASNYTYAEAAWTQTLPDWIASHVRALEFLGAVPSLIVPDNLRSGVSYSCRYDPDANPTYRDFAEHYGTAILPARAAKPKDKAKVEAGVLGIERRVLAKLRNRTFFSLTELNQAISALLVEYNRRPFQQLEGSRRSLFEKLDKPALMPLPPTRYEYAEWKKARVNLDYHVRIDDHYYSVPYRLVKQEVHIRLTNTVAEIFHNGQRVASHFRAHTKHRHTTKKEHMPEGHRAHAEWTPERVIRWVGQAGQATGEVAERIIASRAHPEQGFRACMGIKRLGETYGTDRLEAACQRALAIQSPSYRSVKSILENGLDRKPLDSPSEPPPIEHENVRGADYYQHN